MGGGEEGWIEGWRVSGFIEREDMKNKGSTFLLLLVLVFSTSLNLFLTSIGSLVASAILLFVTSIIVSLVFLKRFLAPAQSEIWDAANKNAVEAQQLIQQKAFGVFRFFSWKQVYGYDDIPATSIQEILETPLIWLLCIALSLMFFFTPTYLEFSFDNPRGVMKLLLFSLLQIIFLGAAFFGMLLTINRKFRGDKE